MDYFLFVGFVGHSGSSMSDRPPTPRVDRPLEAPTGRESLIASAARRLALLTLAQLGWDRNASPIGMISQNE